MEIGRGIEYNKHIISQFPPHIQTVKNQRDILLDTAENLKQIGAWSFSEYTRQENRIGLFLRLTRKNVNALSDYSMPQALAMTYDQFCTFFTQIEKQYKAGISDPETWAKPITKWAEILTKSCELL